MPAAYQFNPLAFDQPCSNSTARRPKLPPVAVTEVPGREAEGNFAQSFPSFGHSMGLAWEHPFVCPNEPTELAPGMVFAIEVEIGRPGAGTGAFEHDVIVTEDGVENLTDGLQRVWWE